MQILRNTSPSHPLNQKIIPENRRENLILRVCDIMLLLSGSLFILYAGLEVAKHPSVQHPQKLVGAGLFTLFFLYFFEKKS